MEDLEVEAAGLDSTACDTSCPPHSQEERHESRAEAEDLDVEDSEAADLHCCNDPCSSVCRLEQTTAGMQQVALEWQECVR